MRRLWLCMAIVTVVLGGNVTLADEVSTDSRAALRENFVKLRFGLFLHFNMATYIDREWANGYEDPALFAPDKLDCGQWADLAVAAGMKYAVLTVKHTGGWCLWDSQHARSATRSVATVTNCHIG